MKDIINIIQEMLDADEWDETIMVAIIAHHGGATDLAERFSYGVYLDERSSDEEIRTLINAMADPCARNAGEAVMMATLDDIEATYGLTRSHRDAHHNNGEEWRLWRGGEGIALWWDDTMGIENTGWCMARIVLGDGKWDKDAYLDINPCETADQLRGLAARVFGG